MSALENQNQYHIPGALIYTGQATDVTIYLEWICYDNNNYSEKTIGIDELDGLKSSTGVQWLNVVGLHDTALIKKIGEVYAIHNLVLEDILNMRQRPVFVEHEQYFFMAAKMMNIVDDAANSEQLSMVVGHNFIITFQEKPGDVFNTVRKRLRQKSGVIRTRNSDYLAFALLDVTVDHYMDIVDVYGDEINDQELMVLEASDKGLLLILNQSKKKVNFLRKYTRPLRDAITSFAKSDLPWIEKKTRPFIKDLLGHINQVADSVEVYRDSINDNLNTYHLNMSTKLNDVLKVLTIFSVVFIPLTFLAGLYGMNFEHMPELSYVYAYPVFLGVLLVLALGMILYFKKKGWL